MIFWDGDHLRAGRAIAAFFAPITYSNPSGKQVPVQVRYYAGSSGLGFALFSKIIPNCRFFCSVENLNKEKE
jgi:hypothetical protein